ncbi:MAG: hypothetical protein ACK5NB_11975 [Flavobacteriaceae bacterium]
MKLNEAQIQQLYHFTRKHYVEHYDVQTELVDHLANGIEQQWTVNPELSFNDALTVEFKKFGVFGFMDVVGNRHAALNKKYNGIVWQHLKTFFTIPKIAITISGMVLVFYVLSLKSYQSIIFNTLLVVFLVLFFAMLIVNGIKKKKHAQKTGKKWLFKDVIYQFGSYGGLFYLPVHVMVHTNSIIESGLGIFIMSIFIVLMGLVEYIIFVEIPRKAEDYLKETYPEYKLETVTN